MITPVSMFCLLSLEKLAKPLQARHTGPLSRDLALAFSCPVRVDAAHRPRETPAENHPAPNGIMLRNKAGQPIKKPPFVYTMIASIIV